MKKRKALFAIAAVVLVKLYPTLECITWPNGQDKP